jgi:hypothetical protein
LEVSLPALNRISVLEPRCFGYALEAGSKLGRYRASPIFRRVSGNRGFGDCGFPIRFPVEGIMKIGTLSESAVALLRFRVRGWPIKVRESDLPAFHELVDAGILKPDGKDFRFTEDGWLQRNELLAEAEDQIERCRFDPPDGSNLSKAARELVRRRLAGDERATPENLEAYRELSSARIMYPVSTWAGGPDSVFRFTLAGWERREEWVKDERAVALHA